MFHVYDRTWTKCCNNLTWAYFSWLKHYHPAAYMAAVMQARPGMYSQQTLEQEAKRLDHPMLAPDINRSGLRFDLEWADQCWHIRKPLTCVKQVSDDTAKRIAWARLIWPNI